eukprot:7046127-Pyramimonas_sp.AAC.1
MTACIQEAQQSLRELELDIRIPIALHASLAGLLQHTPDTLRGGLGICFFDDGAIIVIGHAPMLLHAAPLAAEVVAASVVRRGLRLNFAAGKTEVLFQLRGRGARLAKRELWRDRQGRFEI